MLYTEDKLISENSKFKDLNEQEVKEKFGFSLMDSSNLEKSYKQCEKFTKELHFSVSETGYAIKKFYTGYEVLEEHQNKIAVHKLTDKMGYIASATESIPKDTVVVEYLGARSGPEPYFFEIKSAEYVFSTDAFLKLAYHGGVNITAEVLRDSVIKKSQIDAMHEGNIARFFHSAPGDLKTKESKQIAESALADIVLTANLKDTPLLCDDRAETRSFLVSTRDIKKGEPLCFDYGDVYKRNHDFIYLHKETYEPIDMAGNPITNDNEDEL